MPNARQTIRFGVIGCGLMGREFASAAARFLHLLDVDFQPQIVAVCDTTPAATAWFADRVPTVRQVTDDYKALLANPEVDAVYCAVPHHLHADLYADIIRSGKALLGEKPFGIDKPANDKINAALAEHPEVLVRCSSEMPFFPGAMRIAEMVREDRLGRIIEVEAGFWHSSDLNPDKPINWKRRTATCGAYGCLGDLGMHVMHLPLRFGWEPQNFHAELSKIVETRPDGRGGTAPCETWDNATLLGSANHQDGYRFPITLSTKRIAPGHHNTWFLRVIGTKLSAEFSTKYPKQLLTLPYQPGGAQSWHHTDVDHASAYPGITGHIFEFGFSDAILQMWAAFCDEYVHGRDGMTQPLYCATPEEAARTHAIFTQAIAGERA